MDGKKKKNKQTQTSKHISPHTCTRCVRDVRVGWVGLRGTAKTPVNSHLYNEVWPRHNNPREDSQIIFEDIAWLSLFLSAVSNIETGDHPQEAAGRRQQAAGSRQQSIFKNLCLPRHSFPFYCCYICMYAVLCPKDPYCSTGHLMYMSSKTTVDSCARVACSKNILRRGRGTGTGHWVSKCHNTETAVWYENTADCCARSYHW